MDKAPQQDKSRAKTTRRGATGSGYALTVGLISIVALGAITGAGSSVTNLFGGVGDTLIEVAAADLSISPASATSMNITSGPVPATSSPVQFSIKNIGNSPTAELTASLTNSTDFTIDSDGCTGQQLGSQATCAVTVSMTAVANGSYTGSLRVGGGAKFVEAPLSGTASGLDPASLSVDQPSVSNMDVVGPGSPATGTPVTLTFTNDGEIATGSLSTANDNATNFAISSDTCNGNTLAGGATCSMQVTPQASTGGGTVTATVSVGDGSVSASSSLSGTVSGFSSYGFTSHIFSNCNQTGRIGPSLASCRSAYSTTWDENSSFFNVSAGIQLWTVPETATYRIEARGAQGGQGAQSVGGQGAIMRGDFALTEGEQIKILVGQQGISDTSGSSSGICEGAGGGGTFVTRSNNAILVIAGGGGGGGHSATARAATTATSGTNASAGASGGTSGNGGNQGHGPSGGGYSGNGYAGTWNSGTQSGGQSFLNGGLGGNSGSGQPNPYLHGGFGGGGSTHGNCCIGSGGGGGYSGGGGANSCQAGGGGGSLNNGSNQSNSVGNSGHGQVSITKL